MVTLEAATERATPAMKAVSPARAPEERSRPASGIFTEPEVMLTMRPNFLAAIGSMTFWVSSTATTMLAITPSSICARVSWRKSRNGGPALLFTRMSGSGQAPSSAAWPSDVATSPCTGGHLGAGRPAQLGGGRVQRLAVPTVDDHLAAGLRQCERAGPAQPAARGADDGLAAGNSEIH